MKSKCQYETIILGLLFVFNGCTIGPATYEVWKGNRDIHVGNKISLEKKYWITKGLYMITIGLNPFYLKIS